METITHGRLNGPKNAVVHDLYRMYVNTVVNDFEEHKLVEENKDFRNLMEEYRDGIMLFELMDRNVWGKASKDSAGLKAFYDNHPNKWMWEPGFKGAVYKFKNETAMNEGIKLLEKNDMTDEEIAKKMNVAATPDYVTIQRGRYEYSRFKDASKNDMVKGKLTKATKNADGTYTVVKVDEVYPTPVAKTLEEARGYVVAEYQDYLEKNWNEQMRKKYPVKVNEDVFHKMVSK
jgi:peptidyl-prolyl cis-trans isomerase SurA